MQLNIVKLLFFLTLSFTSYTHYNNQKCDEEKLTMPNRCWVPFCDTGYPTALEKFAIFKAPSDPELLQKWQQAIPRQNAILKSTSHVCAKHFLPHEIIKSYEPKDAHGKVIQVVSVNIHINVFLINNIDELK